MSNLIAFARDRAAEVLFLVIASSALFCTCTYGFHIEDALRTSYAAIIGWTLLLMVIFTACSYSLKSVMIGAPACLVGGIVVVAAVSAACGFGFFQDAYGNIGFFLLLGFVVAAATFLLTRKGPLALVYLIAGALVCGFIQFMYLNGLLIQLLIFLIAAMALYVFASQKKSARELAQGTVSAPMSLVCGGVLCCVALLLSCGVYFAAIAPMNPPAHELKLITKYYSLEEVPVSGYSQVQHQQNQELKSDDVVDGDDLTSQTDSREEQIEGTEGDEAEGVQVTGFDNAMGAIRYFMEHPLWLLIFPGMALLVVLVILLKKYLRKRCYAKMCALAPGEQVKAFYFFFQKRLSLFGVRREETLTPIEQAVSAATVCAVFETGADGATYLDLAKAYCQAAYGCAEPSEESLENCHKLYGVFYQNACQSTGRLKYALTKFFRI